MAGVWSRRLSWQVVITVCLVTFVIWNYWLLSGPGGESEGNHYINWHQFRESNMITPNINAPSRARVNSFTAKSNLPQSTMRPITRPAIQNMSYPRCEDKDKDIIVYGSVRPGYNYSVFSSTVHNEESLSYMFNLPLAALAWERIGFKSIAIVVLDSRKIISNEKVKLVLTKLFELDTVVVILNSHHNFAVMISQVSRLFVPYLVDSNCIEDVTLWEDTYLVTSDADLWPLAKEMYLLPDNNTHILCLNAYCCGDFQHNGKSYSMIPIGSIGMRVKTWRSLARRHGFVPLSVDGIITYFSREFGTVATSSIQKGENMGWFLDQRMITILISDWSLRLTNKSRVKYVKRDVGRDRIDRSAWRPFTLSGKVDTHMLESAYQPHIWHRLEALLVLMYDKDLYMWCREYAQTFLTLS